MLSITYMNTNDGGTYGGITSLVTPHQFLYSKKNSLAWEPTIVLENFTLLSNEKGKMQTSLLHQVLGPNMLVECFLQLVNIPRCLCFTLPSLFRFDHFIHSGWKGFVTIRQSNKMCMSIPYP
jgi:hypothetical protein